MPQAEPEPMQIALYEPDIAQIIVTILRLRRLRHLRGPRHRLRGLTASMQIALYEPDIAQIIVTILLRRVAAHARGTLMQSALAPCRSRALSTTWADGSMQIALYEPDIAQIIVTILRLAACVTFAASAIDYVG